jgi:2-C-methyl-D-erythritol 2,4-cyclodiphosphate synthase
MAGEGMKRLRFPVVRFGQGFDVHAFSAGDHVMLGGVRIPHEQGLAAHSDGDVLLHALCDALLGTLALGDIGHHFPPDDERWADADSRALLRAVVELVKAEGYDVANVDATVICEQPKLAPHVPEMRARIAADIGVDVGRISVKATTTERLGFCGRGEGIAALAVACVERTTP